MKPENFKTPIVLERSKHMHPTVYDVMIEMISWIESKGEVPVITETVTTLKEDTAVHRMHPTHREGRAFDIRTRDWSRELVKEFETHFEGKYGKLGAVGATTKMPNFLLFHDIGHGEHFHVQFNKSFAVEMPKDLKTA